MAKGQGLDRVISCLYYPGPYNAWTVLVLALVGLGNVEVLAMVETGPGSPWFCLTGPAGKAILALTLNGLVNSGSDCAAGCGWFDEYG